MIIIVSVGSKRQEQVWQKRLEALLPEGFQILVLHEDWPGGAGNGLGTLYAYSKAQEKLKQKGIDLLALQKAGTPVALYHTAGEGKRLFPLTASEGCNKSAIKLPDSEQHSILEAVILQTSALAPAGRLSVFWSDQLFSPSKKLPQPSHHVEILAKSIPWPTQEEWDSRHYDQYGFLLDGICVDKMGYEALSKLKRSKAAALSLGSFSLSASMTQALLDFCRNELEEKKQKWDSDPHFWMALTLDEATYVSAMGKRGIEARAHWHRLQEFRQKFCTSHPEMALLGSVDIGSQGFWWDFGTVQNYFSNILKLVKNNAEGEALRKLFGVTLEGSSCLINCQIGSGSIKNSVLAGVKAEHLELSDCVVVNSTLSFFTGHENLLYNVVEPLPLKLEPGAIRASLLYSRLERDGKSDWELVLPGNFDSYANIFKKNIAMF